jgi:hypothetical protein
MSRPPQKTNEILAEAEKMKAPKISNKALMTGVAVGIGSAAIVAALLYANRSRKND